MPERAMLWKKCMTRGAVTGLVVGAGVGALLAWIAGPSVGLFGYWLKLTLLTMLSGAVTGLTTLVWLRGAAQAGGRLSGLRAGVVSGLIAGAIVGGGAALLTGLTGGIIGATASAVATAAATGAMTAVAGVPLGCTVKGWIESD